MLFTSYDFVLFLLSCFVLYYVIPKKYQWILLLLASYGFYFSAGMSYPVILFLITLTTYTVALFIEKGRNEEKEYLKLHSNEFSSREEKKKFKKKKAQKRKHILQIGLLICVLILGIFKYADFVIDNVNAVISFFEGKQELNYLNLLLPMGISFYTFQSIGYLLDVYWERTQAQKNFPKYMLFVSFFPQLIQGPISRYSDLEKNLYEEHEFNKREVVFGLERILWGYFKKLVVADTILTAVTTIIGDEYYNGVWVLIGMIFYGIELYADFTGGIDITIGIAQVFGVKLQENFIRPYFSKNITEYWRRWHISMGSWFRDYIFYPMSISKSMNTLTKKCKDIFGKNIAKRLPVYITTMVTWFATGIWHGASWNFIMWGIMNGVIILISGELEPVYQKFHKLFPQLKKRKTFQLFQIMRTFLLMGSLRLFDCYGDVSMTFSMFVSMFKDFDLRVLSVEEFLCLGLSVSQYIIVLVGTVLMFTVSMLGRDGSVREKIAKKPYIVRYAIFTALFFAIILFGSYGVGYDATQFIYNQF